MVELPSDPSRGAPRWRDAAEFALRRVLHAGELSRMPPTVPRWQFVCESDQTCTWRACRTVSGPFVNHGAAMENAARCGFDPLGCYWTVTADGLTTHYRIGKTPIDLPAGVQLVE